MDINPIDIKIKEFALYLKDFGLLNETNINDFLKKFKNISENSISSSGILETDINVGLIYLKENLSKTMLDFYNLMTEERKKIIYLNIYSKFIQKREKDLQNKGKKVYAIYSTLPIKKYFYNWKSAKNNNNNKNINENFFIFKKPNIFKDLKKDNFCFDIISNNDYFNNNNNIVINSNNNKIIFNTNSSTKFNSNSNINKNSLMNSNNNININSFLLTSKGRLTDFNLSGSYNRNKDKDKLEIYQKPQLNKENILDRLFYPNKIKKELNEEKKYNLYQSTNFNKYNNKSSYNIMKYSVEPKNRIDNIKQNKINNNINTFNNRKTYNNYYKEKEKEELNSDKFSTPINKMRNSYNSSRPKSSLGNNIHNNNMHSNNTRNSERNSISSVYQRLYDQNKEKIKRQEERIKENINEIKERANHPIQKKKNFNNFRNVNKNLKSSISNSMLPTYKLNNDKKNNKNSNFSDKKNISKKIDEIALDKSFKEKKSKNLNKIDEQKRKDGQNFIENQRKCIELFNDMIEKEEKKGGKNFNDKEKENMFKDLLNKLYKENQENQNKKINNNDNINEDEKVNEINNN